MPMTDARTSVPNKLVILMLGATEPHKRHHLGIESVRLLRLLTAHDVHLRIVGPPGRSEPDVRRHLATVDPTGAWTARATVPDRSAVQAQLDDAWLLLQCSLDEGFCLPLVESAARGLPALHTGG